MLENNLRPIEYAGRVYSADAVTLKTDVQQILAFDPIVDKPAVKDLIVLKSPHIDYFRGHYSYGRAYQLLQECDAEIYFLLGTAHQYSPLLFHGTTNRYQSPLGIHPTDTKINQFLFDQYGSRFFQDSHLHTGEHSLELQLPFLTEAVGLKTIVPILVGGLYPYFQLNSLQGVEPFVSFVDAMLAVLDRLDKQNIRYCFIAGVDMAHVGGYFGDTGTLTPERLSDIEKSDFRYLELISNLQTDELFRHAAHDGDSTRICGHSTMMVICEILRRRQERIAATVTSYQQCFTAQNDCCVSVGAMGLYRA